MSWATGIILIICVPLIVLAVIAAWRDPSHRSKRTLPPDPVADLHRRVKRDAYKASYDRRFV